MEEPLVDKFLQTWHNIVDKSFEDSEYKKNLLRNPKQAFEQEGWSFSKDKQLFVIEEDDQAKSQSSPQNSLKLILPKEKPDWGELSDEMLTGISAGREDPGGLEDFMSNMTNWIFVDSGKQKVEAKTGWMPK